MVTRGVVGGDSLATGMEKFCKQISLQTNRSFGCCRNKERLIRVCLTPTTTVLTLTKANSSQQSFVHLHTFTLFNGTRTTSTIEWGALHCKSVALHRRR